MALTAFQMECEQAAIAELKRHGSELVQRRVGGENETYIRALINGTDAEIFIYQDEAGIQGPSTDIRFESSDYTSPTELIAAVVESLATMVGGTDI